MSSRLMSLLRNDRNTEEGRACLDEGRAAGGGTFPICWVFRLSAVSPRLSSRRPLHTSSTRAHMPLGWQGEHMHSLRHPLLHPMSSSRGFITSELGNVWWSSQGRTSGEWRGLAGGTSAVGRVCVWLWRQCGQLTYTFGCSYLHC